MQADTETTVTEDGFGSIFDSITGSQLIVRRYTLVNSAGMSVQVITYGATIASIKVPDADGVANEVTLCFDDLEGYLTNKAFVGCTVGRVANRIRHGTFSIDGVEYSVAQNEGANHLHGGHEGFDKAVWRGHVERGHSVVLSHMSPNKDSGYPGDLLTNVTFSLTADNALRLDMTATTTLKTPVNLTNHAYFNLAGHEAGAKGLFEHEISINSSSYLLTCPDLVPTGGIARAEGLLDLRIPQVMGHAIPNAPGNRTGGGYDHTFVLDRWGDDASAGGVQFAARAVHPPTGRTLEVFTDQPSVQFYTSGNFPAAGSPSALVGSSGALYDTYGAFCLETQNFPDAVNHAHFPDSVLRPSQVYRHTAIYRFGVTKKVA